MRLEKYTRRVFDLDMAYVEVGSGDPIVVPPREPGIVLSVAGSHPCGPPKLGPFASPPT